MIAAAEASATWNGFDPSDATVAVAIAPDGQTVEIVITEPASTAFAGLFLEDPVSIQARAVGGLKAGDPICLLALDSSSSSALHLDSNAHVNAPDCAVHVNSDSSSALRTNSNSGMTASEICVTGDVDDSSNRTISPEPEADCPPKADPLASLVPPTISGCTINSRVVINNGTHTLNPCIYEGGIEIKSNANVTFNPGTYIIKDGSFLLNSNVTIQGEEVSFYLDGNNAVIDFNSNTVVDLSAPTSGEMAGILFFHDRDATGMPVHRINSNSNNKRFEGMLYFPSAKLLVDSNGTVGGLSPCTLMIAKKFEFNSNSVIELSADLDACPVPITTAWTGGPGTLVE